MRKELAKGECTWTSAQMADWITTEFGVTVSAAHLRRFRKRWKLTYQRTARSIQHKQEPAAVASKKEELAELEKRGSRACLTSTIATSSAAR